MCVHVVNFTGDTLTVYHGSSVTFSPPDSRLFLFYCNKIKKVEKSDTLVLPDCCHKHFGPRVMTLCVFFSCILTVRLQLCPEKKSDRFLFLHTVIVCLINLEDSGFDFSQSIDNEDYYSSRLICQARTFIPLPLFFHSRRTPPSFYSNRKLIATLSSFSPTRTPSWSFPRPFLFPQHM